MYSISTELGSVKYCGETKSPLINETSSKLTNGNIYNVTVRYNPPRSNYPTAWIKNNGRCIAVIPYSKEDWKEV